MEELRHFQLRYWDGAAWTEGWNQLGLPAGVEVTVASRSPVDETDELFRRVIYLPGSKQILETPVGSDVVTDLFEELDLP
jgi:hypothetical protein